MVPILDKMVADGSLQFVLDSISDEEIGNLHARPLEQLEPFLRRNAASVFPRPVAAEADLETLASLRREYLEAQRALDGDFGVTEQEDDAEMKALLEAVEAFDEQAERLHCLSRDPELLKVALKEPWLPRDAPRVIESVRGREQARKKEEALPLESGGPVIRLGRTMVEEEVEEEEILEDKDKEIEEVKRGQRGRKTGGVKRKGGRSAVSKPKSSKRKTASASGQDAASEIPEEENKLSSKIKSILTMLQD